MRVTSFHVIVKQQSYDSIVQIELNKMLSSVHTALAEHLKTFSYENILKCSLTV